MNNYMVCGGNMIDNMVEVNGKLFSSHLELNDFVECGLVGWCGLEEGFEEDVSVNFEIDEDGNGMCVSGGNGEDSYMLKVRKINLVFEIS